MTIEELAALELPIHDFLRERLRDCFGGVLSRLAEACDTTPSLAAKWVSEVPERRRTPSTSSCQKIADGLGVPLDYILALAGHRPGPAEIPSDPPALAAIIGILRRRWEELQEPQQQVIDVTVRAVAATVEPTQRRSSGRPDAFSKRLKRRQAQLERQAANGAAANTDETLGHPLHSARRLLAQLVGVLASSELHASVSAAGS